MDQPFEYFCIILILIIILIFLYFIFSSSFANSEGKELQDTFALHYANDRAANRLYKNLTFKEDRIIIDEKAFIKNENLVKATISSSEQEVKIVNKLIYGGPNYKRSTVHHLCIYYYSANDKSREESLRFSTLHYDELRKYEKVANRINNITNYHPEYKEPELKEL